VIIPGAHCSVEFHPEWPLSEQPGAVSQSLGDSGGTVFLHYGPASTLDAYIGAWQGRGGEVTSDTAVTRDGLEGRRMVVALAEEVRSRMGAEREVTPARTLVCDGFVIAAVPVLAGYLTPQETDPRLVEAAEAILVSLQMIPSDSQTPRT
jgi:hypothetical protein